MKNIPYDLNLLRRRKVLLEYSKGSVISAPLVPSGLKSSWNLKHNILLVLDPLS